MPILKESKSTENFWGLQQMLERLSGDSEEKDVHMTLGRGMHLGNFFPIRTVCPVLLGERYRLQPRLLFYLYVWWDLCRPEASFIYLSNLILDLIL